MVLITSRSMGECSFGNGFGQTNPTKVVEQGADEKIWKMIPVSIFNGMRKRYQVCGSESLDHPPLTSRKNVYVKRFLRRFGFELQFDWPKEMVTVSEKTSPLHTRTHI